jgi:flagellar FliJ protein
MQKFKFRLQSVLDHRKAIEDKLLGELGELRVKEQEELKILDDMVREREAIWTRMAGGEFSPTKLKDVDAYATALGDDIAVQELTLESVRNQIEAKIAEIVEASKERKLIEKLREKHLQEYEQEMLTLEQKVMDDAASVRFSRKAA